MKTRNPNCSTTWDLYIINTALYCDPSIKTGSNDVKQVLPHFEPHSSKIMGDKITLLCLRNCSVIGDKEKLYIAP